MATVLQWSGLVQQQSNEDRHHKARKHWAAPLNCDPPIALLLLHRSSCDWPTELCFQNVVWLETVENCHRYHISFMSQFMAHTV